MPDSRNDSARHARQTEPVENLEVHFISPVAPAIPARAVRRPPAPSVSGRETSPIRRPRAPRPADAPAARPSSRPRARRPARGYSRRKSSSRIVPFTRQRPGASFSITKPSGFVSARILPTSSPRMSSIVTRPAVPPNSSSTMARPRCCFCRLLNKLQQVHRLRHERRKLNRVGQVNLAGPAAARACSECRRWCPAFRRKSAGGGA